MLVEAFRYLTERPKLKEAKTFSHLFESIALYEKDKRCKKFWLAHQENCHQIILEKIHTATHYETLLVLGSGHLKEIPIEILSKLFKKIVLVDIVHLNSIKRKYKKISNLEFIEHDLTEIESSVAQGLYQNKVPERFTNQNWGLVISLNLMSQLPLHIERFLEKKDPELLKDHHVQNFVLNITRDHIHYLKKLAPHTLLITDTSVSLKSKDGKLLDKSENYPHLKLPLPLKTWSWHNTPLMENRNAYTTEMEVSAFLISDSGN